MSYRPPIEQPSFPNGEGPRVVIDEAHYNFHTTTGRYRPFAELLTRDGYRVFGSRSKFSKAALAPIDVLVIANALNKQNNRNWNGPTPSAFTPEEIEAVKEWVNSGGSLFLIADHMPFAGAARDLAEAFGFVFSTGRVSIGGHVQGGATFKLGSGLQDCALTRGEDPYYRVTQVTTFTGSAFKPPPAAMPVIVFGRGSVSFETGKERKILPNTKKISIEGWCQGAIMEFGKGRLAVFGEAGMFTAQVSGRGGRKMGMSTEIGKQNYRLLLNIMRWLAARESTSIADPSP